MQVQGGNIRIKGYEFCPNIVLGKGSTGQVYKGYRLKDSGRIAVKAIDMNQVTNDVTQYLLQGEKTASNSIKHRFVMGSQAIIQQKNFCFLIMEECEGGTLKQYIQKYKKINEAMAIQIFRQLLSGYIAVVDAHIIHRDLKPSNIMLRKNYQPVIIDFGYCEMMFGKRPMIKYNVGSPSYMAPQAYLNSRFSEKSDVWALGITLYEMLTGKTLDQGLDPQQYFSSMIGKKTLNYKKDGLSELVQNLLEASLKINPDERATAMKLKYIVDKGLLGKMMPLGPDGLPMMIPLNKNNFTRNRQPNSKNPMNIQVHKRIPTEEPTSARLPNEMRKQPNQNRVNVQINPQARYSQGLFFKKPQKTLISETKNTVQTHQPMQLRNFMQNRPQRVTYEGLTKSYSDKLLPHYYR